jgi:opacity protein-like surface antigen
MIRTNAPENAMRLALSDHGRLAARFALPSLATLLLMLPAAAPARADGLYGGLFAGAATYDDVSAVDGTVDVEFDTGFTLGGKIGYDFSNIRLESELGYALAEGESSAGVQSDVDIVRFTGSAYLDVPLGHGFTPYVGAGLGLASLETKDDFRDSDTAFTWHGEAGVQIRMTDELSLVPAYRYQWIDSDLGGFDEALTANVFTVALRLDFWAQPYRGAAVAAAPAYAPRYRPYSSYRDDPYYYRDRHHHYDRDRDRAPSPEKQERDRCGWAGPGCAEGEDQDWAK